jgi:hypothetical protein
LQLHARADFHGAGARHGPTSYQPGPAELIAYLKWLIYVAAYEDRSTVAHVEFYQKQVLFYQNPANYTM